MTEEETITYNIQYNVQGVNTSIRSTQRLLYFMNAVRLSVVDLQQVLAGPTLSNVMWTTIQLTRVWTHLYRLITASNKAQRAGIGQSLASGVLKGTSGLWSTSSGSLSQVWTTSAVGGGFGAGVGGGTASGGLLAAAGAFVTAHPYVTAGVVVGVAVTGLVFMDNARIKRRNKWVERQREIARTQGLEF